MWKPGICACGGVCVRERHRENPAPLQHGATFLMASLTNGSSFWRAVNCNRHQTPCTENRGASAASSIHCVTENCLNCLSGNKRRICAPFIHNVGQCLPAKSITSHSGAVGDSVMSTLIPPKSGTTSWEQHHMHFSYESRCICWLLLAWRERMERENGHAGWWRQTWQRRVKP